MQGLNPSVLPWRQRQAFCTTDLTGDYEGGGEFGGGRGVPETHSLSLLAGESHMFHFGMLMLCFFSLSLPHLPAARSILRLSDITSLRNGVG